jgi:hypothetical protein
VASDEKEPGIGGLRGSDEWRAGGTPCRRSRRAGHQALPGETQTGGHGQLEKVAAQEAGGEEHHFEGSDK